MPVLFLLASLGAINGFILSIYLLLKKQRGITDVYFSGLIFSLSVRIGKSVFFYFDRDVDQLILQIGLSACLFIGPFFYLFLKSLESGSLKATKGDQAILLLLFFSIITVGIIWPYRAQPEIWNTYIVQGIYVIWSAFFLLGLYSSRTIVITAFKSFKQLGNRERYILGIIISTAFITVTYQFALFVKGFTYIWGAIAFSASFYYLGIRTLINKKSLTPKAEHNSPLPNGNALFRQIEELMISQKPYTKKGLKLEELAKMNNMSRHLLSRVLNEQFEGGFARYINTHRVNEAKNLIKVRHELSLEGIGFEAGFSSKSAFFEAFRKITNQTPSAFKQSQSALKEA